MWSKIVKALIESWVACDPMVYLYWRTHLLEAEARLPQKPQEASSTWAAEPELRLIHGRSEVSA